MQVAEMERELADEREDSGRAKEKHKAELNRLRTERETIGKDARSIADDLMQRLKNACEQRDEAREQVMALEVCPTVLTFSKSNKICCGYFDPGFFL